MPYSILQQKITTKVFKSILFDVYFALKSLCIVSKPKNILTLTFLIN
jgi:hypothetical protein